MMLIATVIPKLSASPPRAPWQKESVEFEVPRPVAPRLLLADRVGWFVLERPVFIAVGCRFWTEPDVVQSAPWPSARTEAREARCAEGE